MTSPGTPQLRKRDTVPSHLYLVLSSDSRVKRHHCCGSLIVESNVGDLIRSGHHVNLIAAFDARREGKYVVDNEPSDGLA